MIRQETLNVTPRGTGWDHHPVPLVSIHPPWAFSPRGQTPRPHCLISPCDDRIAYVQIHILSFSSLFHRKVCLFLYHFIFLQRIKTIPRMRQIYLHKDSDTFAIDRTINGGSEGVVFGTYIRLCENEYQLNISHTRSYNDKKKGIAYQERFNTWIQWFIVFFMIDHSNWLTKIIERLNQTPDVVNYRATGTRIGIDNIRIGGDMLNNFQEKVGLS